jgi:hypothetical protein
MSDIVFIWAKRMARPIAKTASLRGLGVAACTVIGLACVGGPLSPTRSPHDPANADAPEATMDVVGVASAQSDSSRGEEHPAEGSVDARVVYTCPMHPEVQQSGSGKCPKCGMTLVRKQP